MGVQRTSPHFDRLWNVVTSPSHLIEGGLWGFFAGVDIVNLSESIRLKQAVLHSPNTDPTKSDRVWLAQKQIISSYASFIANSSALMSWLDKVYLITVGPIAPLLATIGYGGKSIVSLVRASHVLGEIKNLSMVIREEDNSSEIKYLHYVRKKKVINLAYQISLVAWAVLSVFESVTKEAILLGAHTWFSAALTLFWIELGITLFGRGEKIDVHPAQALS